MLQAQLARHALDRGHSITLFNRGRTNTHLFPEAEKLVGDRNNDLSALEGRRWDVVIDNSGYTPQQVRLSVDLLKDACDQVCIDRGEDCTPGCLTCRSCVTKLGEGEALGRCLGVCLDGLGLKKRMQDVWEDVQMVRDAVRGG